MLVYIFFYPLQNFSCKKLTIVNQFFIAFKETKPFVHIGYDGCVRYKNSTCHYEYIESVHILFGGVSHMTGENTDRNKADDAYQIDHHDLA